MCTVVAVLEKLREALDELCDADRQAMSDGESIVGLHRCLARLEAVTTRVTAAFDAGREWEADGARSAAGWLTGRCRLPATSARRRVRLGRDDAEAKVDARRFHLSQGFGGMWFADGVLDPIAGAVVSNQLRRIADELFEADWVEARARRGDVRRALPSHRRGGSPPAVHRGHPPSGAGAGPGVLPRAVRPPRRGVPGRPPWSAGGGTVAANGRPACAHHNRRRHRRP